MKFRIALFTIGLYLAFTLNAEAAICNSIANQINHDINSYPNDLSTHNLPWMSIAWLQSKLGKTNPTPAENNQLKYRWNCPEIEDSYISVTTDNTGRMEFTGQYNNGEEGAGLFSTTITVSPNINTNVSTTVQTTTIEPSNASANPIPGSYAAYKQTNPTPAVVVTTVKKTPASQNPALEKAIPLINEWFNVDIKTPSEFNYFTYNKIKFYYSNLRSCKPGTYTYPLYNSIAAYTNQQDQNQPLQLFNFATSTISGSSNGFCKVRTTVELNNQKDVTTCNYSHDMLRIFTDKMAKSVNHMGRLAFLDIPKEQKLRLMTACKKGNMTTDNISANSIPTKNIPEKVITEKNIPEKNIQEKKIPEKKITPEIPLLNYIAKFKSCTPGTYTVKRGVGELTSIISGFKNKKCIIQATFSYGNTHDTIKCAYSKGSLELFTKIRTAELTSKTNANLKELTPEMNKQLQQAFQECNQVWIPI